MLNIRTLRIYYFQSVFYDWALILIPNWNMAGVVPPIRPNADGADPDRSPYSASLLEVVENFVLSNERAEIIRGFLEYRSVLHGRDITSGFQWLDGSFLENIEDVDGRPPNDIDVVTFFELPAGQTQTTILPTIYHLFDPDLSKRDFRVDGYPFVLNQAMTESMVRQTAYWYSMWSHRRDGLWKGFVQVDLNPGDDEQSRALLAQIVAGGFGT